MSKLESLIREHLKKQQAAKDAHDAKVKVVQDAISKNIKFLQDATAERNKASDYFHKTTKLTGREFVEALDKLHADIDASTEAKRIAIPDGSSYGAELTETLNTLEQEFDAERIKIDAEEAAAAVAEASVVKPPSKAEEAATSQANDAHESVFQAITKLGVAPENLNIALGVESKAEREKRQKTHYKKPIKAGKA